MELLSSIILVGCLIFGVAVSIVLVGAKRRTWIEDQHSEIHEIHSRRILKEILKDH